MPRYAGVSCDIVVNADVLMPSLYEPSLMTLAVPSRSWVVKVWMDDALYCMFWRIHFGMVGLPGSVFVLCSARGVSVRNMAVASVIVLTVAIVQCMLQLSLRSCVRVKRL